MGFQAVYNVLALRTVSQAGKPDLFYLHATSGRSLIVPAEIPERFGITTTAVMVFDTPVTKIAGAKLMAAMPEFRSKEARAFLKKFAYDNDESSESTKPAPAPVAVPAPAPAPVPVKAAKVATIPATKAAKAAKATPAPKAVKAPKAAKAAKAVPVPTPAESKDVEKTAEQTAAEAASLAKIQSLLKNLPVAPPVADAA